MSASTDVVIIGGGPAGLALALDPALGGRSVTLVEANHFQGFRAGETLAPTSLSLLDALGVADVLAETAAFPCDGNTAAWADDRLTYRDHWHSAHGSAHFLARPAFDRALAECVVARGREVLLDTRLMRVQGEPGAWRITLRTATGTRQIDARFVADASGRRAVVARQLARVAVRFDHLIGVIVRMPAPKRCPPRVLIEARPDGWWYASPIPHGELIVAYMTDSDLARDHGVTHAAGLAHALAQTTHVRALAGTAPDHRPTVRPAWSALLPAAAGSGWIAVGDAATSFDPLSSTGIHSALRTAHAAAIAIERALAGEPSALADYVHARQHDFGYFLKERARVYGQQTRFDTPFWRRRQPVFRPKAVPVSSR